MIYTFPRQNTFFRGQTGIWNHGVHSTTQNEALIKSKARPSENWFPFTDLIFLRSARRETATPYRIESPFPAVKRRINAYTAYVVVHNRSRGPDLQWAHDKAAEGKDQGEALGIRIGRGSKGAAQEAIEKKQPRWGGPLSLSTSSSPSMPVHPPRSPLSPSSRSLFSGGSSGSEAPLVPANPIPFHSHLSFLLSSDSGDYSHSISLPLIRLPATAWRPCSPFSEGERWK